MIRNRREIVPVKTAHDQERAEREAEYKRVIKERLGIEVSDLDPDPLIDIPQIALLAGVQRGTPKQWRNRTRRQETSTPFPDPAPFEGSRFRDKPLWHAISQVIPYLERTGNWPPGAGARPTTRGPRTERSDV